MEEFNNTRDETGERKVNPRTGQWNSSNHSSEKRMKKSEDGLKNLWDIKQANIYITGVPEGAETEKLFEGKKG